MKDTTSSIIGSSIFQPSVINPISEMMAGVKPIDIGFGLGVNSALEAANNIFQLSVISPISEMMAGVKPIDIGFGLGVNSALEVASSIFQPSVISPISEMMAVDIGLGLGVNPPLEGITGILPVSAMPHIASLLNTFPNLDVSIQNALSPMTTALGANIGQFTEIVQTTNSVSVASLMFDQTLQDIWRGVLSDVPDGTWQEARIELRNSLEDSISQLRDFFSPIELNKLRQQIATSIETLPIGLIWLVIGQIVQIDNIPKVHVDIADIARVIAIVWIIQLAMSLPKQDKE